MGRYFEKTLHKNRAGGMAQGEGPEFKPQLHTKKIPNFCHLLKILDTGKHLACIHKA
jgi:hypothetical protein